MSSKKTIAMLPNHPSQIWVLKPVAEKLAERLNVIWVLRDKDVSLDLANKLGLKYIVLSKASSGFVGNGFELLLNIFKCLYFTIKYDIRLWVTKYACGNIAAFFLGRDSVAFNDDDADIVPLMAWTAYPFSTVVAVPDNARMEGFEKRCARYPSSHELFYLHPNRFKADPSIRKELGLADGEKYGVIRLSALQAHHDVGVEGVNIELLRKVVKLCEGKVKLFITSEKPIEKEFEHLRYPVATDKIHQVLASAEFLFGDSQTMTSEAAVLGTPSFRISDFVGRISAIQVLEDYGLSHGYKPTDSERALVDLEKYLSDPSGKAAYAEKLAKYLNDKIDPVPWFSELVYDTVTNTGKEKAKSWSEAEAAPNGRK